MKNGANQSSATVRPKDMVKAGCARKLIGVSACHIHAPHLYLGLPLPPCPVHGWPSVDGGHLKTNGSCPARRVYDEGVDEWVSGTKIICRLCKKEHDEVAEELKRLEANEWEDEEDQEEIALQKAAVKAATYSFRSYNPKSMKLYAQRYGWYA